MTIFKNAPILATTRLERSAIADMVQQLQCERDTKVADLKSALTMIEKVMQFENGYMGNVVPLENPADRMKAAS